MPKDWCPWCPGSGKVPAQFDVFACDEDEPVLCQNPPAPEAVGSDFYRTAPAYGASEIVLYSPDHTLTIPFLPVSRIRKLVDLWAERCSALAKTGSNKYVMPFEIRSEDVGLGFPHPHGNIRAYSWIPKKVLVELDRARSHRAATGECLICRINGEEKCFGARVVFENSSFIAYIPFFAESPHGVFIAAKQHRNYLSDLSDSERDDLAESLKVVAGAFSRIADRAFPYTMVIHQNPVNSPEFDDLKEAYHLHIEFYSSHRGKKMKNSSPDSGTWNATNGSTAEKASLETRVAKLAYLADEMPHLIKESLIDEFVGMYGGTRESVSVFASPARINIIGEHIDYNGGKVFPAAIDKYLYLMIRKRDDTKIVYNDLRFPGKFSFDVNDKFAYVKENDYTNYLNGILKILKDHGHALDRGFDILMFSTIPAGGGVSSSAALEVGFAWAISELYGFGVDRVTIAKMGQQSEHEFMNVKCGIMDQFIIAVGKKDNAIMLDCNTLEYRYVPLELGEYRVVVMNTNKKRQLADSKYNERRGECMTGLAILQAHTNIKALCELSPSEFEKRADSITDPIIRKRVKHCVYENDRVKKAVTALEKGDLDLLGKLLCESHVSLRDDYEVTGIELDTLYEEAIRAEGCIGARMTGAGFGGCAIAIVHKDSVKPFIARVKAAYASRTGIEASFFACSSGNGVFSL